MKKVIFLIIILAVFLLGQNVLAFNANAIVNLEAPYATIYRGTFDNLIMDFSLLVTKPDTVKALSFKNLGSATYLSHIKYMKLWADSGPTGFQGMSVDREIGNFNYDIANQSWYLENLAEKINDSQRFFVTIETYTSLTTGTTINMQIPILVDNNSNGSFDVGDFGIFMDSGNNGPVDANITNSNSQVLSTSSIDSLKPVIIITNLQEGDVLNANHFIIQGLNRDQGNSYIKDFNIIIDGQSFSVDNYNTETYVWNYNWQNISAGQHTISVQAHDAWGNFTQTALLNVNVSLQTVSISNSSVSIDKDAIKNDGLDKATVTVLIKDQNNQPIKSRQLEVQADSGVIISNPNNNSDVNGQIIFEVRSTVLGSKSLTIKTDNQVLKILSLSVTLPDLVGAGINAGDLIKASTPAVYYYGADGKRYVFPNQSVYLSWYSDFKSVKTITDSQLAAIMIGGNVTYKPGSLLVKITTDPKVYAVDSHGTLRWVKTESLAQSLYGNNWASKVVDVADVFFTDYKMGVAIELLSDFSPLDVKNAAESINVDKILI